MRIGACSRVRWIRPVFIAGRQWLTKGYGGESLEWGVGRVLND